MSDKYIRVADLEYWLTERGLNRLGGYEKYDGKDIPRHVIDSIIHKCSFSDKTVVDLSDQVEKLGDVLYRLRSDIGKKSRNE
jgi:hypothetical protein